MFVSAGCLSDLTLANQERSDAVDMWLIVGLRIY